MGNDILEFIDVSYKGVGCYDGSGNLLIISEPDPNKSAGTEYEVAANKVSGFTNPDNITYPTSLAVYNLFTGSGAGGDKYFRYTQNIPSTIWIINHGMNKRPSVIVTDSAGTTIEGQVTYNDVNTVTIEFSAAFSGYAELN
jgi:hypothetical protein